MLLLTAKFVSYCAYSVTKILTSYVFHQTCSLPFW